MFWGCEFVIQQIWGFYCNLPERNGQMSLVRRCRPLEEETVHVQRLTSGGAQENI